MFLECERLICHYPIANLVRSVWRDRQLEMLLCRVRVTSRRPKHIHGPGRWDTHGCDWVRGEKQEKLKWGIYDQA